ncbi:22811_t:CDS:2, partial [Dentiscutata erythropus]
HKLTNETSLEKLSQYAPEILELLTTGTPLVDKEKRRQARNCLQKGYKFSKEQAFALIPHERIGRSKSQVISKEGEDVDICLVSDTTLEGETIKQTAQRIIKDKLSEKDVKASKRITAPQRFRKIISAILNPEVTRLSNKVQKEHSEQYENEGIDFPDHFSLELVKKRLDKYNVSNIPNKQALADVMIMLCIRLAEIKNLRISNGTVTGYAKNQGQQDILRVFRSLEKNEEQAKQLLTWIQDNICSGQLKDPEKLRSTYLSTFLKKDEFIPESGEPLLPSSLRKLGAVFTSVAHGPKNASKANTYASEALQHSPDNHASPSKRYTIINMQKRGEPYNQARPFFIEDES